MYAKIDHTRQNFSSLAAGLRCPLCGGGLRLAGNSFRCPSGHCYDLAAKNYLNLAPAAKAPAQYNRQLFATRRRVFAGGFYDAPVKAICELAAEKYHTLQRPLTVIDAGCGEGFFAARLLNALSPAAAEVYALDLAKDGLIMAAQGEPRLKCLLADLAALPFDDNSADIILNILSPANYGEFRRVLRPNGLLIKVIPGAAYLQEVRAAYQLPPGEESEAAEQLAAAAAGLTESRFTYTLPLNREQAADFLLMTPLSEHRQTPEADFTEITIDLRLFAARL